MFALSVKGVRTAMEDTHVLWQERDVVAGAIFDGHGGAGVAELGREMFGSAKITDESGPGVVLRQIHEVALDQPQEAGGACAVAFRLSGHRLQVANLGDSELLTVAPDGTTTVLTEVHRLSNPSERARVLAAGTLIAGEYMVNLETDRFLMPTRAVGDSEFAARGLLGDPYETVVTFPAGWIVAACDGLWDVLLPGALAEVLDGCETAELACHRLLTAAFDRGTTDNVTVLVVRQP
jgi:serine/threonine protein phosphatase PrpC